ncbi:hypothetical protein BDV98DRAFT_566181 [Pterulicium gracile]|uniref:Uncharacterized protein n=1 Tax=Pterulicium gracile TaxID=1884261 RepID=A0A5C3QL39_9AGAR|nr:hypothetical protein BDV98DRAFT_566181 [Pterula gracilis]
MQDVWRQRSDHARISGEEEKAPQRRESEEQNVLILLRKLREGVSSTNRRDAFAGRVYQTSLCLFILFESSRQFMPLVPHDPETPPHIHIIPLLHHLVTAYPSQRSYYAYHDSLQMKKTSHDSDPHVAAESGLPPDLQSWLSDLTQSMRRGTWLRFNNLSQLSAIPGLPLPSLNNEDKLALEFASPDLQSMSPLTPGSKSALTPTSANPASALAPKSDHPISDPLDIPTLIRLSIAHLLHTLRSKGRQSAWSVLKKSYLEFGCGSESAAWLARGLSLPTSLTLGMSNVASAEKAKSADLEGWMSARCAQGEVKRKEGVVGRWVVCRGR